jgi:hypothetical protein
MSPGCKSVSLYVKTSVNCESSIIKDVEHSIPVPLLSGRWPVLVVCLADSPKSGHTALETSYKVLKTQVGMVDASAKRLQGEWGNRGGFERCDTTPP